MTERERIEKELLLDIVMEASKWRISEGDDTDCIRLEVQDRLRRLNGVDTVDSSGLAQSVLERGLAKAKQEEKQKHGQLRPGYHRVSYNGKKLTLHESQLEKVEYRCSPTGYRWVPKPGVIPDAPEDN